MIFVLVLFGAGFCVAQDSGDFKPASSKVPDARKQRSTATHGFKSASRRRRRLDCPIICTRDVFGGSRALTRIHLSRSAKVIHA